MLSGWLLGMVSQMMAFRDVNDPTFSILHISEENLADDSKDQATAYCVDQRYLISSRRFLTKDSESSRDHNRKPAKVSF